MGKCTNCKITICEYHSNHNHRINMEKIDSLIYWDLWIKLVIKAKQKEKINE